MSGKFDLSVSFSHFNGAVVLESKEKYVKIGLTKIHNEDLKQKLRKSVQSYFGMRGQITGEEVCEFIPIDDERLKSEISLRYGESSRENERQNDESEAAMLLDTLLKKAGKSGATDIHIEENRVRFRISGRLEEVSELSLEKSRELVRRIKILSGLNVLESRKGQDGQFVFSGDEQIFVRVSCIPSVSAFSGNEGGSESVVLRLLNVSRVPLSLSELGFEENQIEILKEAVKSAHGLILICGATGSGKSTTAASLLCLVNEMYGGRKKIITIEDPPEYVLDGCTQIKVDEEKGMSFTDSLRFIFRQDPDVIFIGEIRDSLTARTVLQASLTGHLVVATVHTSGINETQIRMKELGVNFAEFSSVLRVIVFQKLVCADDKKLHLEAEVTGGEECVKERKSISTSIPLLTKSQKIREKNA
ncbi:MAG: Flp pilus assembly complex ATPase component TadA [Treponema sp.]|nr:Flp pilus assembly complex ATPase component TadA [Treponema sp.]